MNRDDAEQQSPSSPQVYRRQISREDAPAADVFARLGAGVQDPVPGGLIREYSGKVSSSKFPIQVRFRSIVSNFCSFFSQHRQNQTIH